MTRSGNYSWEPHTSSSTVADGLINRNDSDIANKDNISSVTWDSDIPTCQYDPNLSICQTIDKIIGICVGSAAGYSSEHEDYTKFRLNSVL